MDNHSRPFLRKGIAVLGGSMLIVGLGSSAATAQSSTCCAGDDNNALVATAGLGKAAPKAPNLSIQPAWQAYLFTRNGINFVQINDASGVARMAVGEAGNVPFALPVGSDPVVFTSSVGSATVVYSDANLTIAVQANATTGGVTWLVVAAG